MCGFGSSSGDPTTVAMMVVEMLDGEGSSGDSRVGVGVVRMDGESS